MVDYFCYVQQIANLSYIAGRPHSEILKEREAMRKAYAEIRRTPETARGFLLKHGFITKGNKVGKRYR